MAAEGATGTGSANAECLAAEGTCIVAGDLNPDDAMQTARRTTETGVATIATRFDLTSEDSIHVLHELAVAELGGGADSTM